jgi:hypothetical protein
MKIKDLKYLSHKFLYCVKIHWCRHNSVITLFIVCLAALYVALSYDLFLGVDKMELLG